MPRVIKFDADQTLDELKRTYNNIVSDWNGKDSTFVSGGTQYTEDDVKSAQDILDTIENLEGLLDSFNS